MNPVLIITILRAILCQKELKEFLLKAAGDSSTPVDDVAVRILYMLLTCE